MPCLADLEAGLVATMERAGISPIRDECSPDPFEVDIDAPSAGPPSFDVFGVGSLRSHPLLRYHFPEELATSLNYRDFLMHLLEFCESDPLIRLGAVFEKETFERWLCSKFRVSNMRHLGVVVESDLHRELIVVREILSKQRRMELAVEQSCLEDTAATLRASKVSISNSMGVPKVVPRSQLAVDFVEKCRANLDSPYPPAYSKLREVVRSKVLSPTDGPTSSQQIQEVCCEYAMLCLGKRKHRMKFFCDPSDECGAKAAKSTEVVASAVPKSADNGQSSTTRLNYQGMNNEAGSPKAQLNFQSRVDMGADMKMNLSTSYQPEVIPSLALKSCLPRLNNAGTMSNAEIGRWGEAVVFNYLLLTQTNAVVEWVNETQETLASYDIVVTKSENGFQSSTFLEVKSTRFDDRNVFSLSFNELEFMMNHPRPKYDVYRVFNAGDPEKVRICILRNVFDLIRSKEITLCLAI